MMDQDLLRALISKSEKYEKKVLNTIDPELQSIVGQAKEMSFNSAISLLKDSDTFVAKKLKLKLFGPSKHNKNNREYTERNLHDFFVFLKEIKYIKKY